MSGLQEKMTSKGDSCLGGVSDWSAPEETKLKLTLRLRHAHINKPCNEIGRLGKQQGSQVYIFNIVYTSWIWQVECCSVEQ